MWGARGNPGGAGRSELLVRQRVYKQRQFAGTDEREGRRGVFGSARRGKADGWGRLGETGITQLCGARAPLEPLRAHAPGTVRWGSQRRPSRHGKGHTCADSRPACGQAVGAQGVSVVSASFQSL